MRNSIYPKSVILVMLGLSLLTTEAEEWTVPLSGNAFRTAPNPGRIGYQRDSVIGWSDQEGIISVFVYVDRPAKLDLAIVAQTAGGDASIVVKAGPATFPLHLQSETLSNHQLGHLSVPNAGYVRLDFKGNESNGTHFGFLKDLLVTSTTQDLRLDFVRNNSGNMFYWGRRGASVHLRYDVPQDNPIQYAYNEITVPPNEDPPSRISFFPGKFLSVLWLPHSAG